MASGGPKPPKLTRYTETSYESKVYAADKNFMRASQEDVEYEMSNPKGTGPRVFKGFYRTRGPYAS